ncbi:putative hydrolase of the HAD superfamily [Salirhabdus euzebyi]|uniref:Putative hydrolase of the HAD superfamily n=1 Tax=Salirhabdus euzebyi TaxID=394506 RepID=A0A841PUK5_9BACI|nr:HAD family hydrolase [Salirhabdus euzebyi]MBB6452687.1 putative hydrolase of the HAD superfamily [Salirhabdus euzebyi]
MIKAVVFDFDGLIVDTESIWYEAYRDVLVDYGIDLQLEQFAKVIGTNDTVLYDYIRKNSKKEVDRNVIEGAAHKVFHEKMGQPALREGVREYLNSAKRLGLKIGLASSSSRKWVTDYLKIFEIDHYFETIHTRDDVQFVKPDPALYLLAVDKLHVKPNEALAFEDSLNGMTAALNAGLYCVIVPNPVTSDLPFQDFHYRLQSMSECSLEKLLNKINT